MRRELGMDETQAEAGNGEPDPMQVQQGRRGELEYTVLTLQMFEIGTWYGATSMGGRAPTTQ